MKHSFLLPTGQAYSTTPKSPFFFPGVRSLDPHLPSCFETSLRITLGSFHKLSCPHGFWPGEDLILSVVAPSQIPP